jgi:hypothetical protein
MMDREEKMVVALTGCFHALSPALFIQRMRRE